MPPPAFPRALQPAWRLLARLATVQPKQPKMTVGLDIGSSAVKAVVLGPRRVSGARPLLGHGVAELGENPETQAPRAIQQAVSGLRLHTKAVNISVSGHWVIMRIVEMTKLAPAELAQALPFEAQRYLPFNIQDVVLDGAILGPAEENKVWVLMVACKRELLERRISWTKQVGLDPEAIDVDALAVANAFVEQANARKPPMTEAVINVGAQWTNLFVLKANTPFLVRDIPWGAVKLIRHMAEQLGIEESALVSQLEPGASLSTQCLEAMKVTCESLTTELQLSFDFFENRFGSPPEQVLVTGGLNQCPGFFEALKSHLAQSLAPWEPASGLSGQFAVAYGLALRAA